MYQLLRGLRALPGADNLRGGGGGGSVVDLTDQLVAFWKLDNTSDAGPNSLTLTNNGTTTFVSGKIGNAASLNGSSQWLSRADSALLSTGDIDFSVSAWVYFDTVPATAMTAMAKYGSAGNREYWLGKTSGNVLAFNVYASGTTANTIADSATISTSAWYHVAATHDSVNNQLLLWVNGTAITPVSYSSGTVDGNATFEIGRFFGSGYIDGLVDAVGFWKRTFNQSDVYALYNAGNGVEYPFS